MNIKSGCKEIKIERFLACLKQLKCVGFAELKQNFRNNLLIGK